MVAVDDKGAPPRSPGWDQSARMEDQERSAIQYQNYLDALRNPDQVEREARSSEPSSLPELSPANAPDPQDGKLRWAMEHIDNARQQREEPDRGPSAAAPARDLPPNAYEALPREEQEPERDPARPAAPENTQPTQTYASIADWEAAQPAQEKDRERER